MSEKKNTQLTTEQLVQIADAVTQCYTALEKIGVNVCVDIEAAGHFNRTRVFFPCKRNAEFMQALPINCRHRVRNEFGTDPTVVFTYCSVQGVLFDVLDNLNTAK